MLWKRSRCKLFARFCFIIHFNVIFLHLFHIFHRIIIRSLRFDSIMQNLNVLNISKKYFKFQKYFFNFVNIDLNVKIIFHELKRENKILIGRKLFREIPLWNRIIWFKLSYILNISNSILTVYYHYHYPSLNFPRNIFFSSFNHISKSSDQFKSKKIFFQIRIN